MVQRGLDARMDGEVRVESRDLEDAAQDPAEAAGRADVAHPVRSIEHDPFDQRGVLAEEGGDVAGGDDGAGAGELADPDGGKPEGFTRFIRREPVGVVLVLAPWNYPYLTSINAVIPAIMAGNTVILKMAQQTCRSSQVPVSGQ